MSVHKSLLLSALTFNTNGSQASNEYGQAANGSATGAETGKFLATFATASGGTFLNLADISVGVITKALENIAFLRAQNGVFPLGFQLGIIDPAKTNMRAALGRMVDVDIAEETTNLAKYSVLSQASASMLAQANANTDLALMLLR